MPRNPEISNPVVIPISRSRPARMGYNVRMRKAFSLACVTLATVIPLTVSAQTIDATSLSALQAQLQTLASAVAALQQSIGSITATASTSASTTIAQSATGQVCGSGYVSNAVLQNFVSCTPTLSSLVSRSSTLGTSLLNSSLGAYSGDDAVSQLMAALAGSSSSTFVSPADQTQVQAATSSAASSQTSSVGAQAVQQVTSAAASASGVAGGVCTTSGATMLMPGSLSCIGPVCMPVPSATLTCTNGTWQ